MAADISDQLRDEAEIAAAERDDARRQRDDLKAALERIPPATTDPFAKAIAEDALADLEAAQ